jgi:hypothetical protein
MSSSGNHKRGHEDDSDRDKPGSIEQRRPGEKEVKRPSRAKVENGTSTIRDVLKNMFSKDRQSSSKTRAQPTSGSASGYGAASMELHPPEGWSAKESIKSDTSPSARPPPRVTAPFSLNYFGAPTSDAPGRAGGSAAPALPPSRRIADYYNFRGESTMGTRKGPMETWDHQYPREIVLEKVPVFSFRDLQGYDPLRRHDDPWFDLSVVPPYLTRLSLALYISKHDLTQYILSDFQSTHDFDLSHMHKILDHNMYQIPWGNFIMPSLCTQCNAVWMDSFHTENLTQEPSTLSYDDYARKKRLWLEIIGKPVMATSRTDGGHFNGCLYVFPRDPLKQGFIILMDPYNVGKKSLYQGFKNIARNLIKIKRTAFMDPEVNDKSCTLDPSGPAPQMNFIMVTHPAHLTQGVDSGCAFWCLFQLTYWINHFGSSSINKDPDIFSDFLTNLFSTAPEYDFNKINLKQTVVDRENTMRNVRRFGLLQLQYLAQAKDAYDCLMPEGSESETTSPHQKLMRKVERDMEFDKLMSENPRSLLKRLQTANHGYVSAGSFHAIEHYNTLKHRYSTIANIREKEAFLSSQNTLDLLRLCMMGAYKHSGSVDSPQLIKETMHYPSLPEIHYVESDINNYRPCKIITIESNITNIRLGETLKPLHTIKRAESQISAASLQPTNSAPVSSANQSQNKPPHTTLVLDLIEEDA